MDILLLPALKQIYILQYTSKYIKYIIKSNSHFGKQWKVNNVWDSNSEFRDIQFTQNDNLMPFY